MMGRSSNEQARENRRKIVNSAVRLFRQSGVENVSVAEIMNGAGMTIGGFYKHFDSKDALVEEAFVQIFEQSSEAWRQICENRHDTAVQQSTNIVDYYLKKKRADQACPMIAFAPHVRSEAADESSCKSYRDGTKALYDQFLDHMVKSRATRDTSSKSDREAKVLFAAMIGARLLSESVGDTEWIRSLKSAVKAEASQGSATSLD